MGTLSWGSREQLVSRCLTFIFKTQGKGGAGEAQETSECKKPPRRVQAPLSQADTTLDTTQRTVEGRPCCSTRLQTHIVAEEGEERG